MKSFLSLLCLSLLLTSCIEYRSLRGTWTGIGYQIDESQWDVVLQVKGRQIDINYPSLSCNGEWRFAGQVEDDFEFKELILEGIDRCDQGVEVHVQQLSKHQVAVQYYLRWYNPNDPIATATLTKAGSKLTPRQDYK